MHINPYLKPLKDGRRRLMDEDLIFLFNPARTLMQTLLLSVSFSFHNLAIMMEFSHSHKTMRLGYILFRRREEGLTFTKITLR